MKALEALTGSSAPASSVGARGGRPPGSGRSNAGKRAAGRRAPRGQRRQQVVDALKDGELGPSAIARQIGDVNPTQISGLLRQLASEGVVSRTAGGKWQLTAATEHQQQQSSSDGGAAESPAQDASAPAEPVVG